MNVSVVVLNWARPFWLRHVILPLLARHPLVDEIVVSHGREDTSFKYSTRHCSVVHRHDWSINASHGLSRRFVAAERCRNEAVLLVDDDLVVKHATITELRDRLVAEPRRLHGILGKGVDESYRYRPERIREGEVPILITRCVMMHRSWARVFLDAAPLAAPLIERGTPLWNGEDIFLSLLSIRGSGLLPRVYPLPFKNIPWIGTTGIRGQPAPRAGSHKLGHAEYRRWFTREAVLLLGIQDAMERYLASTAS